MFVQSCNMQCRLSTPCFDGFVVFDLVLSYGVIVVSPQHSNCLFHCLFSWYDVITCKSIQIIGCALSDAFSKIS